MNDVMGEARMQQHLQDRRLRFELYEEEKWCELSRFDAETILQIRARAKLFRNALVRAYRCAPVADLLADAPGVPDVPAAPGTFKVPKATGISQVPGIPDALEVVETPGVPDVSEVPGTFEATGTSDVPDAPGTFEVPGTPEMCGAPDSPGVPETFDVPGGFAGEREELAEASSRKSLFSEIPRIEGERIVLDRVVATDADALRDLICNARVQRYEPTYLFEKQFDDAVDAIANMYGDLFTNKESLILAIRVKETGELAGLAEFYGLRDLLHKISVGYRLRECWWGHGLATEAARLMVAYLYGKTDIEVITASTMIENKASAHVLEKAQFIHTAHAVGEDWGFPEPVIVDKWFC